MRFFDPKIDIAFKKLFGSEDHKRVTISFLNTILEYTGDREIESIQFMNTEQLPVNIEKKENILDIFCIDKKKRHFIIEMQNAWMKAFGKRIVYYGAKTYSHQLSAAKPYSDLDPVTVVAVTKFNIFPEEESYKSIHHIVDRKTNKQYLDDLTFAFIELPKFTKKEHELITNEDKWLFLLKEIIFYDHIPEPLQKDEFKEACQILNMMTWSDYEQAIYEKRMLDAQAAEATADLLLNAQKYAQECAQKAKNEAHVEMAKKLLDMGLDAETIQQATGLSLDEITTLKK